MFRSRHIVNPENNSPILMKWFILLLTQAFTLRWPYDEMMPQLITITRQLHRKVNANIQAIYACSLKYYMLTKDSEILVNLGYWALFGYPESQDDENLEFCLEFGGFSVPRYQQNETLAYKYFTMSKSEKAEVYMSFIDYQRFLRGGPIPRSIRRLKSSNVLGKMAYFTYQFNCLRFRAIPEIELSARIEEMYNETECLPCQTLINVGFEIVQNLMPNFETHIPEAELTKEDFLILEQQALNGEPEAQLQYAYQFYAGNDNLGVQRNQERARQIFANMTPSAESYFNQGLLHLNQGEYEQAINFFQLAITLFQMPEAMNALAFMHLKGYGVEQDMKVAEKLLQQSYELGSVQASKTLGIMKLESNAVQGVKMLLNSTDYDAKNAIMNAYIMYGKQLEPVYGCQTFLNITKELIEQIYEPTLNKNFKMNPAFTAFIGGADPATNEEKVLYGIDGAISQLAHSLSDKELRKKLYKADLRPDSYIELSLIELYDGNVTDYYVNALIRECLEGKWDSQNLFVAYVLKALLMVAKLFV